MTEFVCIPTELGEPEYHLDESDLDTDGAILDDRCFFGTMRAYLPHLLKGIEGIRYFYRSMGGESNKECADRLRMPILGIEAVEVRNNAGEAIVKYGESINPDDEAVLTKPTLECVEQIILTYTYKSKKNTVNIPVLVEDQEGSSFIDDISVLMVKSSPSIEDIQSILDVFEKYLFEPSDFSDLGQQLRQFRSSLCERLSRAFCGVEEALKARFLENTRGVEHDVPEGYEIRVIYRAKGEREVNVIANDETYGKFPPGA